jgi:zinc transport system substrate-binding protein
MKFALPILLASATVLGTAMNVPAAFAAPDVVVSIKPIHSLVAAIMKGVAEPKLIVDGAASPHTFTMKPSNAKTLEGAGMVFWVGHGMEAFLEKPLEALASKATVVTLEEAPGLEKLKFREGGAFEPHDDGDHHHGEGEAHAGHDHAAGEQHAGHDDDDDDDHDHEGFDTHLWLDPMNAKAMASEIERALVQADPANAAKYQSNGAALMKSLDALDAELKATLAPVKDKPFIVFHDAYQYFEHRYDVTVAGSITVSPETMPGAERISQIHKKVADLGATCVFAEPQFEPKLVSVVTEGSKARSGVLDPEAATLKAGPDLYFELMRGIAASLTTCLGKGA